MLVLEAICEKPTYGYALMATLKNRTNNLFVLKEGTLYPILYRLEDDGLITASWSAPDGRAAPKKMYTATPLGQKTQEERRKIWDGFVDTVNGFYQKGRESL